MTAVVRSLPGTVDHDSTPTGPIPADRYIDREKNDYDVRLDLSGHIDLIALVRAIQSDTGGMYEWNVLMHNRGSDARRLMAQAELRSTPAIRAALTVKLTPEDAGLSAGSLAERLEEASVEPARCIGLTFDKCNRFAVGEDELCAEHLADLHEHGPEGDRGSYQAEDD